MDSITTAAAERRLPPGPNDGAIAGAIPARACAAAACDWGRWVASRGSSEPAGRDHGVARSGASTGLGATTSGVAGPAASDVAGFATPVPAVAVSGGFAVV